MTIPRFMSSMYLTKYTTVLIDTKCLKNTDQTPPVNNFWLKVENSSQRRFGPFSSKLKILLNFGWPWQKVGKWNHSNFWHIFNDGGPLFLISCACSSILEGEWRKLLIAPLKIYGRKSGYTTFLWLPRRQGEQNLIGNCQIQPNQKWHGFFVNTPEAMLLSIPDRTNFSLIAFVLNERVVRGLKKS